MAGFPKCVRLLRSKEFRRVYEGYRFSNALFSAYCVREPDANGPRIGFTVPRALGKAVVRNRIKRRMREAVRHFLNRLNPQWWIVINPRRKALEAPFADLLQEMEGLVARLNGLPWPPCGSIN